MNANHSRQAKLLYKIILRLNRGLPPSLKELGNSYVRAEFKRHKDCNEAQAKIFMKEWTSYAVDLSNQLGLKGIKQGINDIGNQLSDEQLDNFNDEQIVQLYELMHAAKTKDTG